MCGQRNVTQPKVKLINITFSCSCMPHVLRNDCVFVLTSIPFTLPLTFISRCSVVVSFVLRVFQGISWFSCSKSKRLGATANIFTFVGRSNFVDSFRQFRCVLFELCELDHVSVHVFLYVRPAHWPYFNLCRSTNSIPLNSSTVQKKLNFISNRKYPSNACRNMKNRWIQSVCTVECVPQLPKHFELIRRNSLVHSGSSQNRQFGIQSHSFDESLMNFDFDIDMYLIGPIVDAHAQTFFTWSTCSCWMFDMRCKYAPGIIDYFCISYLNHSNWMCPNVMNDCC